MLFIQFARWQIALVLPAEVGLARKDDIGEYSHSRSTNILDHCGPSLALWLDQLWPAAPVRPSNQKLQQNHTHYKPSFVKFEGIFVKNVVLDACGLHKAELRANCLWILCQDSLSY